MPRLCSWSRRWENQVTLFDFFFFNCDRSKAFAILVHAALARTRWPLRASFRHNLLRCQLASQALAQRKTSAKALASRSGDCRTFLILEAHKEIAVIPGGCRQDTMPVGSDAGENEGVYEFLFGKAIRSEEPAPFAAEHVHLLLAAAISG